MSFSVTLNEVNPHFFAQLRRDVRITGERPKPRLYISGPMTGYPDYNYPAFRECAKALRAQGWDVEDPSEHFNGQTGLPRHKYLAADVVALVTKCRGIVLLDHWFDSEGARLEAQIAVDRGYEIYRYVQRDALGRHTGLECETAKYVEEWLA